MTKEWVKDVPNWEKEYLTMDVSLSQRQKEILNCADLKSHAQHGARLKPTFAMWRAKLGEKNHLNSVQYGVNPIEPSPPGWTLTPLFQEVQFVKETCARIALENAALVAQNGKLKAEMAELREDVATTNGRIDEVEVLRERDVHHLKQEIAKLHSQRNADREHFKAALEAERDEVAKQFAAAARSSAPRQAPSTRDSPHHSHIFHERRPRRTSTRRIETH